MDASLQRRLSATGMISFLVAGGGIVGYVAGGSAILGPVLVSALSAALAAQIWFIVGAACCGRAPAGKV